MKKLFIAFTVCLFAVFTAQASTADLFSFNEESLTAEFADLNELETLVSMEGVTYSALVEANHAILSKVDLNLNAMSGIMGMYQPPLGIPSFVWGLCLGAIGILLVYLITDDGDETKKALWGCVAGVALYAIIWVVWIVILGSSGFWII